MGWFIIGFLALIIYFVFKYYQWVWKYPKGPFPLPFWGNLHQVENRKLFKAFEKYAKEYGPVFTMFIPTPFVVISDYEAIKEAYVTKGDEFVDRQQNKLLDEMFAFCSNGGVVNSNGENWREQRRVALSILHDLGMGKNVMEEKVKVSISNFFKYLDNLEDKDRVDFQFPIQLMISNIINGNLFGYQYEYDNAGPLITYVEEYHKFMEEMADFGLIFLAMMFPFVKHIPYLGYHSVWKHKENYDRIKSYIVKSVDKAMETYEQDGEPECLVHAYKQRAENNKHLTHDNLLATCADFFAAGTETTSTTLRWAMVLLADNIVVQEKLRQEILEVVGPDRLPSMTDRPQMPYAMATVLEIQRRANILSFNAFRAPAEDAIVKGVRIPAKSLVNGDLHNVLANDPLFTNSEQFYPERFLNEDGRSLNKELVDRCIPFSMGKRQCAGEALARVELFLGLTATIQNYRILPPLDKPIDLEPVYNTVHVPKPTLLRIARV